jgi:RHS repeat-associated protein
MRLAVIDSSNNSFDASLAYDGQDFILEGLSGGRTRRYVRGPGVDEPLVAYLVTPTGTSRLWYQADERGSVVRHSNDAGTPGQIGKYDEYGVGGTGRIRYAGQYWLGDGNLIYSRARIYDARLGRFLQPDPIGYGGGMNLYAYVSGDPVNFTDPLGLQEQEIVITGTRCNWICRIGRALGKNIGGGSSSDDSGRTAGLPIGTTATQGSGREGGPSGSTAPKQKKKKGEGCNQQVLDVAHGIQDFSQSLDDRGNEMIVIAGVAAIAGVPLTASVVGAPAGVATEITAGGIATVGLGAKALAGLGEYVGDGIARIETGTQQGFGKSLFSAATSVVPGNSVFQDVVQDQVNDAAKALVGGEEAPRTCPGN